MEESGGWRMTEWPRANVGGRGKANDRMAEDECQSGRANDGVAECGGGRMPEWRRSNDRMSEVVGWRMTE